MNKVLYFGFILAFLSLSLVLAQNNPDEAFVESISDTAISDENYVNYRIHIVSPVSGTVVETSSNEVDVLFKFRLTPSSDFHLNKEKIYCVVNLFNSATNFDLNAELNSDYVGISEGTLLLGDYEWMVTCKQENRSWNSDKSKLVVSQIVANNGGGSSGGSSGGNDEERGGRRRVLLAENNLSLDNLSNPNNETSENSEEELGFSKITGAVIGFFGKRSVRIVGVLLVILGVSGFLIYNRTKFGLVKTK